MRARGAPDHSRPRSGQDAAPTLALARALVRLSSVTPHDGGCQALLAERLAGLGFVTEHLRFGAVSNLWARRGAAAPLFLFAGHTDVVPAGPSDRWSVPPFAAEVRDGYLYGRGAADMKGSLAAMLSAVGRFVSEQPDHRGSIAFLITSDEEGPARDGTVRVLERLREAGTSIDWCLIGEPSSERVLGDVIKNGRRGSLNGHLEARGREGHIAYPDAAINPVHGAVAAFAELLDERWDEGRDDFPPTSFQISNVHAGSGAVNVIPGALEARFNFRYSTAQTHAALIRRVEAVFDRHGVERRIDWQHSGAPFLTKGGALVDAARRAVRTEAGVDATLSTSGGTSDGRFIAPTGAEVIELGPVNASIHKVDERVRVADLETLSRCYASILERLLGSRRRVERGAGEASRR